MEIRDRFEALSARLYGRPTRQCTEAELFHTLLVFTKELMADKKQITGERKLYYISAEFIFGKVLSINVINVCV